MPGQIIATKEYPDGRTFTAVIYDLLDEPSDAIVNAANSGLAHGGGVAAAIARAAGPELERDGDRLIREQGAVPVGRAVVTSAGRLRFKGVIHAVGPRLGDGDEETKIASALESSFRLAAARGWSSVSFPAISSGIFAVPPDVCARAYLRAADEFFAEDPAGPLKTLRLALFEGKVADAVRALMEAPSPR